MKHRLARRKYIGKYKWESKITKKKMKRFPGMIPREIKENINMRKTRFPGTRVPATQSQKPETLSILFYWWEHVFFSLSEEIYGCLFENYNDLS